MYSHTQSALGHGTRRLLVASLVTLVGLVSVFFPWTLIYRVIGLMILCVGAYKLFLALVRLGMGGRWEIVVDEEGLRWDAPRGVEASHHLPLERIARIELRRAIRAGSEARARHVIIDTSGAEHELGEASEVDFDKLTATLREQGVEVVEVRTI